MNKRLLFLFSILLAFGVSNAQDLWGASSQDDLWGDENKSYKTKEEKKAAVRRQARSNQSVNTQQTAKQNEPSVQQNTDYSDEWNTFSPAETATQRFDLIPVDNSTAVKDFDMIPVDNSTASEDFGLIPVDNSTANDHFGLIPVETSCKGTSSSKQIKIEQAKLAQVKAELAAAQQQKEALDKANQQKAEQAAAAAKSTPQPKPQAQPSNIKVHWIPLSICAGVAITGGVLAVIFDNKASAAANRIPVNHNTYKQSYDDAGNYQTKRNIAIGIAAAGLVGMGITFLF